MSITGSDGGGSGKVTPGRCLAMTLRKASNNTSLASAAVRRIIPKLDAKIVAIYKEPTLEIIEHTPDSLLHSRRISDGRLQ